jgi:hypothetical protein
MAAETSGMFREMCRVRQVVVETSLGRTEERAGTSRTSSNVSPSGPNFSIIELPPVDAPTFYRSDVLN